MSHEECSLPEIIYGERGKNEIPGPDYWFPAQVPHIRIESFSSGSTEYHRGENEESRQPVAKEIVDPIERRDCKEYPGCCHECKKPGAGKCQELLSPIILTQPQDQTVYVGDNTSFSVTASGTWPLYYQWRKNGKNLIEDGRLTGTTNGTLTINRANPVADLGTCDVVISNDCGSVTSAPARPMPGCRENSSSLANST